MSYSQMEIDKIKSEAKECLDVVGNIDEMVSLLSRYKFQGKNVYFDFNGKRCYSLLDTPDSCYLKITGQTMSEYKENKRKWLENMRKEEAEEKKKAQENIPAWIEEGKKYIYAERADMWAECVNIRADDLYHGSELVNALEVMKYIEEGGDFAGAKKIIDEHDHSGHSYNMTMSIITTFSKKGPEFYRFATDYIRPETEKQLKEIEAENEKFKANQSVPSQPGE